MKVTVTNPTGSVVSKADLVLESGLLIYENGEISHVLAETQLRKVIHQVNEASKAIEEALSPVERTQVKPKTDSKVKSNDKK